jgi:hypothetical protein
MPLKCTYVGPLPKMFVSKEITKLRQNWFQSHQLSALHANTADGEDHIFSYTTDSFCDLLKAAVLQSNYLRIYFGSLNGKLSLIYAFETSTGSKTDTFRMYQNGIFVPLEKPLASRQVSEYLSLKADIIANSVGVAAATRAVTIEGKDVLNSFIKEIEEQDPLLIKAQISSYTDMETDPFKIKYSKMIFVEFNFQAEKDGRIVDVFIDDCPNFKDRDQPAKVATVDTMKVATEGAVKVATKDAKLSFFGFDNTTLCPPGTDCVGELGLP